MSVSTVWSLVACLTSTCATFMERPEGTLQQCRLRQAEIAATPGWKDTRTFCAQPIVAKRLRPGEAGNIEIILDGRQEETTIERIPDPSPPPLE